jgi:hypothetical protein
VEAVIMLDCHDKNYFILLNKNAKSSKTKRIKIQMINQISLDATRGNFQHLQTEELRNFVSLFLTAESLDLLFFEKKDLDSFLFVMHDSLTPTTLTG